MGRSTKSWSTTVCFPQTRQPRSKSICATNSAPSKAFSLRLGHFQIGDGAFGVVGEANPVDAVGRFQFPIRDQVSLGVARDHRAIDGTLHFVAFHRKSDGLAHRFSWTGSLVHRSVRLAVAVHLERLRSKSAHDEISVAVGRTIQLAV